MRAPWVDKNGVTKGAWSEEEDNKLRAYILRYGHWNWRLLPKFAGLSRCGKSCRLRWVNYLKPGVRRGSFSEEEEDLILKLQHELGNKWSAIAAKLQGRTDNEIKNYWHTHLKKRRKSVPAIDACNNPEEASFQGFDRIPILESSGSGRLNWDSVDSAWSSRSARETQTDSLHDQEAAVLAETCDIRFFQDHQWSNEMATSSSVSFESFWTEPFVVDTSYIQAHDQSFSPLEEGDFFNGYLYS